MPAGKTHDKVTLWLTPLIIGGSFGVTRNERLTLLTAIAFVFSGLMFGPDLDIYSRQYQRWGWLRWMWLPYRKLLRHRSPLSHGFLLGTVLRLLYVGALATATGLGGLGGLWLWHQGQGTRLPLSLNWPDLLPWAQRYQGELLASFIGLELGAMSHSLCDWTASWLKRQGSKRRSGRDPLRSAPSPKPSRRPRSTRKP
jgi:uncharacterized metal-binding protein